ncbi:hypothetical protein GW17_00046163 [Ensete ventricosum]|nr:hypothetical protein GW17_00046163 [Ensete ventricosum]RZR79506.1 hypothetical protein BHM03_00005236 [Ensete ventricosum]
MHSQPTSTENAMETVTKHDDNSALKQSVHEDEDRGVDGALRVKSHGPLSPLPVSKRPLSPVTSAAKFYSRAYRRSVARLPWQELPPFEDPSQLLGIGVHGGDDEEEEEEEREGSRAA